jgi:hypothetical protein
MKVRLTAEKVILCHDSATVPEEVNEMWSEYMKNVDDYDKRFTEGWKEDSNGVLVFVSPHLLVTVSTQ